MLLHTSLIAHFSDCTLLKKIIKYYSKDLLLFSSSDSIAFIKTQFFSLENNYFVAFHYWMLNYSFIFSKYTEKHVRSEYIC